MRVAGGADRNSNAGAAPYPGTGFGLQTTRANLTAMANLFAAIDLKRVLPDAHGHLPSEISFYLGAAAKALEDARAAGINWPSILADKSAANRAAYAALPLLDSVELLADRIPTALGLVAGFNSLDGD